MRCEISNNLKISQGSAQYKKAVSKIVKLCNNELVQLMVEIDGMYHPIEKWETYHEEKVFDIMYD